MNFRFSVAVATLFLAACGSDTSSTPANLTGTVATGAAVAGGSVTARCGNGSNYSTTTGAGGTYGLVVPAAAFPCAIRASGGSLPAGTAALHSFAAGPGRANVTPLTDLALALQVNVATGQSLADWFATPSNWTAISTALGDSLDDLRDGLIAAGYTLPPDWTAGSTTPVTGSFTPDPATDAMDQLLEELAATISDPASTFADYDALLAAFVGGASLPTATGGSGGASTVPATLHASLVKTYNLVFKIGGGAGCGSVCSYTDNQEVTATVNAGNTLSIGGKTLADPFHRKVGDTTYTTEIIWQDGDIEYALSDNSTGAFNEINVGNDANATNGFPQFLGQMTALGGAGNALITQFAGSYGITHQYKGGTLAWTSVTIGDDGSITFNDEGAPSITADDISVVTDRLSCCGRVDIALGFDLDGSGTVTGTDRINLYADASGNLAAIEYPTGTSSQNDVGVRVNAVPTLVHDGAAIPASASLKATAVISGGASTALEVPMAVSSYGSVTFSNLNLSGDVVNESLVLQQQIVLRLEGSATLVQGQTLDCYEYRNGNKTIRLSVKISAGTGTDYSSEYGGKCSITLTTVQTDIDGQNFTLVEGTFTGELYPFKRNNPPLTIQDGVFRWVP